MYHEMNYKFNAAPKTMLYLVLHWN